MYYFREQTVPCRRKFLVFRGKEVYNRRMMVLDLDLDFFLTDCCPLAKKGERPCSDAAKPWDEAAVTDYLERHLGLSKSHPIPGIITQTHDGALPFWQTRMERGLLTRPFSVVHIDAHADLGIGKPGPGIVLNGVLGIDPKIRDRFSRYYENRQLDEANYLLFALAFRWINALTLVRDPFSRPDLPPFCERTEHGWQPIRLPMGISGNMSRATLSAASTGSFRKKQTAC